MMAEATNHTEAGIREVNTTKIQFEIPKFT